ncbi:hypothetical protein ACUHMQ_05210 [Chitinimonas sp. PSY-7]|uniref:hypothetical protein n=1 Tax=Chitinimonas sp. PSY-7 TaxID=3459088 RepID=UPI00403FD69F
MITQLHETIVAHLQSRLPSLQVCAYPDLQARVQLPLLVIELSEFEPGDDPGTGQLALIATMQARLILDPTSPDAELHIRQLAARVGAEIHRAMNFGLPITPARIRQIGPDGFSRAELDGYLIWLIEWVHELDIGEIEDLTLPAISPTQIAWGFEPDVGIGHADQYEVIRLP